MIYFIDQTSEYDHHMVFNSSMIKILRLCFPDEAICYYGLASSIMSVKSMLSTYEIGAMDFINIRHGKLHTNNKIFKGLNYIRKECFRVGSFIKILNISSSNDWIVLSITTFTSFLWFKIIKMFFKTKVIAVLHGDVSYIYKYRNNLEKLNAFIHKAIFKIRAFNFFYLTLNKIEKQILVDDGYLKWEEVLEIEHPFSNIQDNFADDRLKNNSLSIGHLGTLDKRLKNSHYLFLLAEMCREEVLSFKVNFKGIGLMQPSVFPYKNELVDILVGNGEGNKPKYLPRNAYENYVEQLDYSVFFYPIDEYIFRASGAIIDTIAKCKPVICLRHPFFEYLFRYGGDIGFMCESLDEMAILIKAILQPGYQLSIKYAEQVNNLRRYRENFSIENIAGDLRKQINRLVYI